MSYTNTTSHYSLPQYVGSDKPKYLTDFNEAMATIDGQMYDNATTAATADSKAEAAQSTADTNTSSISSLNTQINGDSGLAADVAANQGAITTINSLIGNGEPTTTDKTIIGAINELDANKADASDIPVINNNYALIPTEQVLSISADGVKTAGELLTELRTAAIALVADLEDDEAIKVTAIEITNVAKAAEYLHRMFTKGQNVDFEGRSFYFAVNESKLYGYSFSAFSGSSSFNQFSISTAPAFTIESKSSMVPAATQAVKLYYVKYKKIV